MSRKDPTDIAELDADKAAREDRARLAAQQERADVKWLMSGKQGRRVVWRLLSQAGVFRSTFSTNAMQSAFNEGARNSGLLLLNQVHAVAPELYPQMVSENT
jgi:hypothetical protein